MSTPGEAVAKLDELARELGDLSAKLNGIEKDLEPVEREYMEFVDNHEIGLYQRSVDEDGFRLPSESMRVKLANRAMPAELFGRRTALVNARVRTVKRISDLKVQVEAQRSILSALKAELEGGRGPQPSWSGGPR